jgi:ATP-dependent exoDNAse (exonuclease V) beta subunit
MINKNNKKLKFKKKTHTYTYEGKELISVTTFISKFFPEFNAKEIARKLNKMRNTKWYKMGIRKILALWKEQASEGTKTHEEIELFLNDPNAYAKLPRLDKRASQGIAYLHQYMKKLNKPYIYSELKVFSTNIGLAGTIDLALLHTLNNGELVIDLIDWKTSEKDLDVTHGVLDHPLFKDLGLPNSKLVRYSLQLNLYKVIIEAMYPFKVNKMQIVHLLEDEVRAFDVKDVGDIVYNMLNYKDEVKKDEKK